MNCSKCDTELIGLQRQMDKGKYKKLPLCTKCYLTLEGLPIMPPQLTRATPGGFKPIIRGNLYVE